MESDEEIRRVPEMGLQKGLFSSASGGDGSKELAQKEGEGGKKTRGRNPGDKESKRLKRLLRNRVSAQQARERKKAYVSELETKVKDIETRSKELEEKLTTLQNENQMLRQILKNTTSRRAPLGFEP